MSYVRSRSGGYGLAVFGWAEHGGGSFRCIVAARTKKEAAAKNGRRPHELFNLSETGNVEEIKIALEDPDRIFFRPSHPPGGKWKSRPVVQPDPKAPKCFGCEEPLAKRSEENADLELAPNHTVKIHGGRGWRSASSVCRDKARLKNPWCLVCGEEHKRGDGPAVCARCVELISIGRAQGNDALQWHTVARFEVMPDIEEFEVEKQLGGNPSEVFAKRIARAFTRGRYNHYNREDAAVVITPDGQKARKSLGNSVSGPQLECTAGQGKTLADLLTLFRKLLALQREAGRREGRALLVGLAEGTVTVDDWTTQEAKLGEKVD